MAGLGTGGEKQELFQFIRKMIHFRKEHKVIGHELGTARCGFPAVSVHTLRAWDSSVTNETRTGGSHVRRI